MVPWALGRRSHRHDLETTLGPMVELRLLDPDAARSAHRHHCRWLDDLSFDDLPGSISPLIPHVGGVTLSGWLG
jgi:hypothetical protein